MGEVKNHDFVKQAIIGVFQHLHKRRTIEAKTADPTIHVDLHQAFSLVHTCLCQLINLIGNVLVHLVGADIECDTF